jgi:hypothetical protein
MNGTAAGVDDTTGPDAGARYTPAIAPDQDLPNALYIGLARAGSTWLSEVLRHHPDVFVPEIKDLYFFDREHARGLDWYRQHFTAGAGRAVRIEFSHDYLHIPFVPERVRAALGEPKLLLTLREPAAWVLSNYQNMRRNGSGTTDIGWAIAEHVGLVSSGLYSHYLRQWRATFPAECFRILLFDDLRDDPDRFLAEVLDGLGVAPMAVPELDDEARNAAAEARWAPAARVLRTGGQVVRRVGQPEVVGRVKRSKLVRKALYRPVEAAGPDAVSDEVLASLRTFFRDDVHELAELTGVDVVDRWGY